MTEYDLSAYMDARQERFIRILKSHQEFIDCEVFRQGVLFYMDYRDKRIHVVVRQGIPRYSLPKEPYEVILMPISTSMNNGENITLSSAEIKDYRPDVWA